MDIALRANARFASSCELNRPPTVLNETSPAQPAAPEHGPPQAELHDVEGPKSEVQSACTSALPEKFEWTKLDKFAKLMQANDETRHQQERREVERRVRGDLDKQMEDIRQRKERERRENLEYAKIMANEVEQWKEYDRRVAEERKRRAELEKLDRDEQLQYDKQRRKLIEDKKREEDCLLLDRIESERRREQQEAVERRERDRLLTKELMRENEEGRMLRVGLKKSQDLEELERLREYHEMIEKQERAREAELNRRLERQKLLIKRMEENVTKMIQAKSNDDNVRALKQQAERDARAIELERYKESKLRELTEDMRRMLDQQTREKEARKTEESELKAIHARILQLDTDHFRQSEAERAEIRRKLVKKYREQLDMQVASMRDRKKLDKDEMSYDEILINRELIQLVQTVIPEDKTLSSPV